MKLESLKSSRFKEFKKNIIKNPLIVTGGRIDFTEWDEYNSDGSWDDGGFDSFRTDPSEMFADSQPRYVANWGDYGEFVYEDDPTNGNKPTIAPNIDSIVLNHNFIESNSFNSNGKVNNNPFLTNLTPSNSSNAHIVNRVITKSGSSNIDAFAKNSGSNS
jgi:hypothetical protein